MWTYETVIDQKNKIEKITEENNEELYSILYSIKEIIKPFIKKEKYEMDKKRRRNYHPLRPKPDILNKAEKSKDDAIKDQMLGELNKLSNQNFDKILKKVQDILKIHSMFVDYCIEHIFIMATAQSIFCELYVKFIKTLQNDFTHIEAILNKKCEGFIPMLNEFKNQEENDGYLNNVTQENYDKFCEGVKKKNFKKGFTQFTCCLVKNELISKQYLRNNIEAIKQNLEVSLQDPKSSYTEDNIMCLVETFTQYMQIITQGDKEFLDMIKKTKGLPSRLKFKIMDLQDLLKKLILY